MMLVIHGLTCAYACLQVQGPLHGSNLLMREYIVFKNECRIRGNKGETMVVHRSIDALATKSKMFIQMCPCSIYGGVGVAAAVTGVRQ